MLVFRIVKLLMYDRRLDRAPRPTNPAKEKSGKSSAIPMLKRLFFVFSANLLPS